jgi:trimethylamine-N-oxide reductase (cytochrome c)
LRAAILKPKEAPMVSRFTLPVILYALTLMMRFARWRHPQFAARLKERNLVAQIKARDEDIGRWIELRDGKITSRAGIHPKPDITLAFKNATIAASLLTPPINWLNQINAQKDFVLSVDGEEDLTNWFAQVLMGMQTAHWTFGTPMPDGSMRYCNMANGGPLFVTVKDGKIIRTTPIEFDDSDPQPWTIEAHGMKLTPPRKTTLAPHGQICRSTIYSPDRLLYPMKRVDFDPKGKRNPENRGK